MGFLQSRGQAALHTPAGALRKAHAIVQSVSHTYRAKELELISFAMSSKVKLAAKTGIKAEDFGFIVKLLDGMVSHLQKEGDDDATHKGYCEKEFAKAEAEGKSVEEEKVQKE